MVCFGRIVGQRTRELGANIKALAKSSQLEEIIVPIRFEPLETYLAKISIEKRKKGVSWFYDTSCRNLFVIKATGDQYFVVRERDQGMGNHKESVLGICPFKPHFGCSRGGILSY